MEIARAREYIFTASLSIFSFSENIYIFGKYVYFRVCIFQRIFVHHNFPDIFLFTPSHNILMHTEPLQKSGQVTMKMEMADLRRGANLGCQLISCACTSVNLGLAQECTQVNQAASGSFDPLSCNTCPPPSILNCYTANLDWTKGNKFYHIGCNLTTLETILPHWRQLYFRQIFQSISKVSATPPGPREIQL